MPGDADHDPRTQLLRLALRLLAASESAPPESLTVTIAAMGQTLTFTSRPGELNGAAPPANLTPAESAILRAATREKQTAKALARIAGYRSLSHARAAIARLCDLGLLVRAGKGTYRLPDR